MFFRALLTDSVYLETDQGLLFDSVSVYLFVTSLTNTETRSLASYFPILDLRLCYTIFGSYLTTIITIISRTGAIWGTRKYFSHPQWKTYIGIFLEVWSARPWWAFCCKTCNNLDPTEYPPLELTITSQSKSIQVIANENNGFQKSCFN